ncbi:hypothetical protein BC831DRAFT_418453 [Entophlyctis helioformis]|nr:hypothetical protein BC831DRAFT_418453 [Entophlyctis helioformis]
MAKPAQRQYQRRAMEVLLISIPTLAAVASTLASTSMRYEPLVLAVLFGLSAALQFHTPTLDAVHASHRYRPLIGHGILCGSVLPSVVALSIPAAASSGYARSLVGWVLTTGCASLVSVSAYASPAIRLSVTAVSVGMIALLASVSAWPAWMTAVPAVVFWRLLHQVTADLGPGITAGESMLMASAASMSVSDTLFLTLRMAGAIPKDLAPYRSHVAVFLPALLWGMTAICVIQRPLLNRIRTASDSPQHASAHAALSSSFMVVSALIVGLGITPWTYYAMGCEPFSWTIAFLTDTSTYRPLITVYWTFLLMLAIAVASTWTPSSHHAHINARRKYFHALAFCMFVPCYILDTEFMVLAFAVSVAGLVFVECVRVYRVANLQVRIQPFFAQFLDSRDNGPVVLSHLYLLVGCALPVWLAWLGRPAVEPVADSGDAGVEMSGLAGVLALGVGDALASLVGKAVGRVKWARRDKSVEGTAGFVAGVLASMWAIAAASGHAVRVQWTAATVGGVVCTALLEAFSEQNDNLVIPLYLFAMLNLASR